MARLLISSAAAIAMLSLQSSCSPDHAQVSKLATLDGYDHIKFGVSFTDIIGIMGSDLFNPVSVSECAENMPIDGCSLYRREDSSFFTMQAGIPYALELAFSKFDKLFRIGLVYNREGNISKAQCLEVLGRSIDWASKQYGEFKFGYSDKKSMILAKSPEGRKFEIGATDSDFFFGTVDRKYEGKRNIEVMGTFINVDGVPMCSVAVHFNDDAAGSILNRGNVPDTKKIDAVTKK